MVATAMTERFKLNPGFLGFYAQGGVRNSPQPFLGYQLTCFSANTIGLVLNANDAFSR